MNSWKPSSGYSADDIMAMQKDAIARVREMQRRADQTLNRSRPPAMAGTAEQEKAAPPPAAQPEKNGNTGERDAPKMEQPVSSFGRPAAFGAANNRPPMGNLFSMANELLTASPPKGKLQGVLNALHVDNERLLILILLILLYNDGADYTVLLALLYLLI